MFPPLQKFPPNTTKRLYNRQTKMSLILFVIRSQISSLLWLKMTVLTLFGCLTMWGSVCLKKNLLNLFFQSISDLIKEAPFSKELCLTPEASATPPSQKSCFFTSNFLRRKRINRSRLRLLSSWNLTPKAFSITSQFWSRYLVCFFWQEGWTFLYHTYRWTLVGFPFCQRKEWGFTLEIVINSLTIIKLSEIP